MLSHDEFRQQKGDFEMKKEQNRHSLHLIRQNVPQFILLTTEVQGYRKSVPNIISGDFVDDAFIVDFVRVFDKVR